MTRPDDDIRRDEAHEERHAHYYHDAGRRHREVPIWGLTAGTWAQFAMTAVFGAAIYYVGAKVVSGKGALDLFWLLGSFGAGFVLAAITWRAIGQANRDRARTLVRWSPAIVVLVAGALVLPQFLKQRMNRTFEGPDWKIPHTHKGWTADRVLYENAERTCLAFGLGWVPAEKADLEGMMDIVADHHERFWVGNSGQGPGALMLDAKGRRGEAPHFTKLSRGLDRIGAAVVCVKKPF